MPHPSDEALARYREKRSADRTTEPFGSEDARAGTSLFMVHKHAARNLHYDLRLEIGGTLRSWAVPKGFSYDPREKRFAVAVEDHPLPYADFEGVIPQGSYGAGPSIVWDRGQWVPIGEPEESIKAGKLLFELRGYKLRGLWALVKTKRSHDDWLLIKETDGYAKADPPPFPEESVLSGLTVEELGSGASKSAAIAEELRAKGAVAREVRSRDVEVMLANTADEPFSSPEWLFELKYDGYRLLAGKEKGEAKLTYRSGGDATPFFPEVARAIQALPFESFLLDGEVVCVGEGGKPVFNRLQTRGQLSRKPDIQRASVENPATLYLFDLVAFEGLDCRSLPLTARKDVLRRLLPRAGPLRYLDHIPEKGRELYEEIRRLGLEGVMAKRAASRYAAGRSPDWLKLKVESTADFAVVGFTEPKSTRVGFGGLDLAVWEAGRFVYAGRVGSGFTGDQLTEVRRMLEKDAIPKPACEGPIPKERGHNWVTPRYVCEVKYREFTTADNVLRFPVFLRFRDDKRPEDCPRPAVTVEEPETPPVVEGERKVVWTRTEKVFWPEDGLTKGDMLRYYEGIAPWLLPYLLDRPLVLTRYPDGVNGKSFFQVDAPSFVPDWLRTERMWGEGAEREIAHFIADDVESLMYLANIGTIPLHVWSSRVKTLATPDWTILDLDPKGAPFADVVRVALAVKELCDEAGLPSFVKTSGSTGLHVLVPLGRQIPYEPARQLAELLARIVVMRLPEIATVERMIQARGGKVYVDFGQVGHGKLLAAPFSVRPKPGAPVSMPLLWEEVNDDLSIAAFNIRNGVDHMKKLGSDPLRPVLDLSPDLGSALARLAVAFGGGGRK